MKRFGLIAAGLCAAFALAACNSTESQNTSAGAVSGKQCCTTGKTCSTDAKTCAKGEACCKAGAKAEDKGSMGAVGGAGECGAKKAECSKQCPATGATKDASMGTVSDEKKSGCCSKANKVS
jgi:hypothetical protein